MSINLFNDCDNEFLYADGQLLFKKTFIDKNSDLLKNILINYSTDEARLQSTWNSVVENKSVSTENDRELAVILILNAMALEFDNYIIKKVNDFKNKNNISSDADPRVSAFRENTINSAIVSYKTPQLSNTHTNFFVNNILPIYENAGQKGVPFTQTHLNLNLDKRFLIPTTFNPEHCFEFASRFPIQDLKSYQAYRLGNEGEPLLGAINFNGSGFTPKGVMSINTLVFPTTVAPVLAFNKNRGTRNAEMSAEIHKYAEHFAYTNRISASTSISQESRKRLFEGAKELYNTALENDNIQDLVASAQSELESSVQSLSQDRSSPYFGMSPSDIKAGLLSKILGGSKGYSQFAHDVEEAINKSVNTIDTSYAIANVAIARFELSDGGIDLAQANEIVESQNESIVESTENVADLISLIRPILVIDEDALKRRGFSVEPKLIQARSNDGGISFGAVLGVTALLIFVAVASIAFIDLRHAEKKKEALDSLKSTTVWLKEILTKLKNAATAGNMEFIVNNLNILVTTTLPQLVTFYKEIKDFKDDITFVPEVIKFEHLQSTLKSLTETRPLTLTKIQSALGIQIAQAQTNEQSLNEAITLQKERIQKKEGRDFFGSLLKLGVDTTGNIGNVLKYAGYVALGMFSIWGGVKVYRSLNK
jgi:hypothetical protein